MCHTTSVLQKPVRTMIATLAVAAGWWLVSMEQVRAGRPQPSPFAGCYSGGVPDSLSITDSGFVLTIGDSGRISGATWWGGTVSGRIWDDGYIELEWPVFSFEVGRGGRRARSIEVVGMGTLDADGNLIGMLQWPWGEITEFLWGRC